MKTQIFLAELRGLGVILSADQGRLRLKARPGILTEKLKATIADHKQAIISCLEDEHAPPPKPPKKMERRRLKSARNVLSQLNSARIVVEVERDGLVLKSRQGLIHGSLLLMAREFSEEIRHIKACEKRAFS